MLIQRAISFFTDAKEKAERRQEKVNTEILQSLSEEKKESDIMEEQKKHLIVAECEVEAQKRAVDHQRQALEEKREEVPIFYYLRENRTREF